MEADQYATQMKMALKLLDSERDRSRQTKEHRLGVSDVGGCGQYAVNMIRGVEFSDSPDHSAALVGTALHVMYADARAGLDPEILVDATVKISLPNGIELEGHPDAVDRNENSVTDDKSKNRLGVVRRSGPTAQEWMQVHLYALGCVQAGLLIPEGLIVRLIYYDRSGVEPEPLVYQQTFDQAVIDEAVDWLNTVTYAVSTGEEAERTPSIEWCRKCCPYFSVCRLPSLPEVEEFLTEERVTQAAEAYLEGKKLSKQAESMVEAAKAELDGSSGITDSGVRVRWISIPGGENRQTSRRIDVRKVTT